MKKIRDEERLHHILETIDRIDSFLLSVDAKTFSGSQEKQMAVCMGLTLIGEAARNLTSDFCSLHSEIPWAKIIGMRNYLVHDYIRIDYDAVWQTAKNDLPLLKTQITNILAELPTQEKTPPTA
ncbi:MAG: DUF86 domain-containing protein [Lentisphaeria bacterium]|nr:DUF86 domain-containing protein [Lentisphaeria bacterium]